MKTRILLLFACFSCGFITIAQNPLFFSRLEQLPPEQRLSVADSFQRSSPVSPIVEADSILWFFAFAEADQMALAGDPTNWMPRFSMKRIAGTTVWYTRQVFPPDARFEYKLVKNGKEYLLDPCNPHQSKGGMGTNSEICMPAWTRAPETLDSIITAHGSRWDTTFFSSEMNEMRSISVWLPPDYDRYGKPYPVVFFNDGQDYFTFADIPPVLDRLKGLAVVAVMVHPVLRDPEYSGSRQKVYTNFVVKELVPFIDKHFRIAKGPENHAIAGISNGGNSALWIAVQHPEIFGRVLAQSSNIEKEVMQAYRKSRNSTLRVCLDSGTYDLEMLLPLFAELESILKKNNFSCQIRWFHEGHNWGFWRNQTASALYFLFGRDR